MPIRNKLFEEAVRIQLPGAMLDGILELPQDTKSLIIFAHGSGSSRLSPRNTFVARYLQERGFGTLLVDLLTEYEDRDYQKRFDIKLLSERLIAVTDWSGQNELTKKLRLGYFGASTGAAAALQAAAKLKNKVAAIVSRGGRVDLAAGVEKVKTPTLLIVGSHDYAVLELNETVFLELPGHKEIAIIPGATHLFEETGALGRVAELASSWFLQYLTKPK